MKHNKMTRMIASALVLALTMGLIPASAAEEDNAQEVWEQGGEAISATSDPMLGVQSGVEDIPTDVPAQPRSREELMALDSVVLSEDGEPVAILGSEDNITFEEMKILFSSATSYGLRDADDPDEELREKFGLTDADIEQGSSLHGSRLAYTSELSSLVMKAKDMNMSEAQVADLAGLISSGYLCYHAMRALVAKDLLGFTLDELKNARKQEILTEEQEETEEVELAAQDEEEEQTEEYSPNIVGLPSTLTERAMEVAGKDAQSIEQDITAAMRQAYSTQTGEEESTLMTAAASSDISCAPEEVLGQPYRYAEQGNFNVNLNTGSYSYSETDLSIPGKNGLDLVLTRQYHSDRANTIENLRVIYNDRSITQHDMFRVHYRWYELDEYGVYQELVDQESYYADNPYDAALASAEEIFAFDDYESAVHQKAAMAAEGIWTTIVFDQKGNKHIICLVPTIEIMNEATFAAHVYGVDKDDSFYVDEFGLGHGWMLGLSHLRWVRYGCGEMDDSTDRRIQLTLSDGTQYMIDEYFSGNGIENYDGDDIKFCECTSSEYPNAAYALRHKDGRVEYFNNGGQNIAIRDRFGNTIAIAYTLEGSPAKVKKIQITDTVGNLVVYEEIPVDNTKTHRIGGQGRPSRQYNKMWQLSLNGAVVRKYYSYAQNRNTSTGVTHPVALVGAENEAGEVTLYGNTYTPVFYNCFLQPTQREALKTDQKLHTTDGYDLLVTMNTVDYPNRGVESISATQKPVRTFSGNGYHHYIRCDSITSMSSASSSNPANTKYTYGDFDGLELRQQGAECYTTTAKDSNQYSVIDASDAAMSWVDNVSTYTFNTSAQNTKVEKQSYSDMPVRQDGVYENDMQSLFLGQTSWESQVTEYEYANDWSLWPKTIKTIYKDSNAGKQMTRTERYTYDQKGNVLTYEKPNGQPETYTYDSNYSLPLTASFSQDANTVLTTTNTLSADGKSIASTEVKSNDVTVSKSVYSYDNYGQLTAQDDYKDAANYVTTSYSYDYATSALPTQVSVAGVKTVGDVAAAGSPGFAAGTIARKQTYNERGWITSETDAKGNTTSYTYDAAGRITGVTYPNGDTLGYSYNVPANTVTYTDQAGSQWLCSYGKSGKLLQVTDLTTNQVLQENTYDRKDRLVKQVIYGGTTPDQTTYYRYDTDGRLIQLERVAENGTVIYEEKYKYEDGIGKVTKTVTGDTNAPSIKTTSYQDNMGNVVKTGILRNNVEELDTFAYDYLGNQTQAKTAFSASKKRAYTTQATYDYAGRVLSTTNTMGKTAYKTYDWLGNQLTDKDLKGNVTTMTYDVLGRLLRTSTPMDSKQTSQTDYTYDPNGNVTQEKVMTGPSTARITDYTYDSLGRLTQAKGNAKQEGQTGDDQFQYTDYTYDPLGNIKTMSVGDGTNQKTTQYTYDRFSRLTQYKDALNHTETYTYALNGLLTSKTDRRGVTTTNTYDAMGRLTRSTAGEDGLAFSYTKTGQRRTADCNGRASTYTYDEVGNLIQEVTPVATKTMTYGIGGLRSKFVVTANGKTYLTNTYDYDVMGRMSHVDGKGFGAASAHYSYGTNGNLASTTYGDDDSTHYTYNKANLPTEVKAGVSNLAGMLDIKYTYGRDGNQLTKTDDRGSYTTYAYDGLNRLIGENQTGTLGNFSKSYAYDAFGNRQSMTTDGVTTNYTYDAANRLLSAMGDENATYTYDNQGNMTQAVFTVGDTSRTVNCTYDGFNRLKKFSDNSGETVYTYDADGLRSSKTTDAGEERYVYDNGQLVVTLVPPVTKLYDGTIPASGTATVPVSMIVGQTYYVEVDGTLYSAVGGTWSQEDINLAAVPMGGGDTPEEPPIDPDDPDDPPVNPGDPDDPPAQLGAFVGIVAGDVTIVGSDRGDTAIMEGPAGAKVAIYNNNPTQTDAVYIRGLSLIYGGTFMRGYNYHYDAHGNVVQLAYGRSGVVKDYYYDAFGVEQNAAEGDTNPFRYCGEQFDTETGDYYLRARYYTPGVGRFTQEDPIRDGLNWYAYCAGNPVGFVDPSGHMMLEPEFPDWSDFLWEGLRGVLKGAQTKENYTYNEQFSVSGIINAQGRSPVSDYKYGGTTLSRSGCEVIANYNALIVLGNPQNLNDVANWGENHGQILNGAFGTLPSSSKQLFEHLGYTVTEETDSSKFDEQAAKGDVSIFTFWNNKDELFRGVHTVAIKQENNKIYVYNRYDDAKGEYEYASFDAMIQEKNLGPCILYIITK